MPVRRPVAAAIYGIDLGKTRFDVIASDPAGRPVLSTAEQFQVTVAE